jgi:hypothetical protein
MHYFKRSLKKCKVYVVHHLFVVFWDPTSYRYFFSQSLNLQWLYTKLQNCPFFLQVLRVTLSVMGEVGGCVLFVIIYNTME